MQAPTTTIPIHPASSACGGCVSTEGGAACRSHVGQPCLAPRLTGPHALLCQALEALRGVVDPESGRNLVDLQLVQALRIEGGEAELTLAFARGCGANRLMAEDAFQVLRRLLPDTDVYIGHAS